MAFDIPRTKAGTILYSVGVDLHEDRRVNGIWSKLPTWRTDRKFFVKSIPQPYYKAFVSRGIRPEDRLISDPLVEMIKEWGFDTVTVGIEKTADPNRFDEVAKNEIKASDCLIAIATRRYIDALTGLWRTLEWLHGETGIGFGVDKQLLLVSDDVVIEGLPGYMANTGKQPTLSFNPLDLDGLRPRIDAIMPSFRDWISGKNLVSRTWRVTISELQSNRRHRYNACLKPYFSLKRFQQLTNAGNTQL